MSHRRALPFALLLTLLSVGPVVAQSPEIESLRAKAEKGNSIAQYNLGLAYQAGREVEADWPEAFVWLTIAAENGTTGKALQNLIAVMTPSQLAEGQRRLVALRGVDAKLAAVASTNQIEDDPQRRLSAELALAWQESDQLKTRLDAATTARDQATAELAANTRELATLRASVAKLQTEQATANDAKLAALQSEVDRLKAIATQMGTHNQELEDAAALRGRTLDNTRNELTQAEARVAELTGTLTQMRQVNDAADAARTTAAATLTATRQDLATAQNAQATATRELQQARTTAATLQQTLERTREDTASLQQQLARSRSELSSGADEISALRATLANLQDAKSAESNQQIASLQGELKRVKAEAATLGQRHQQLEDTAAERGRLLEIGRKDLDQAEARIDELALNLQQIREGRDDTTRELSATTSTLNAARQELAAAQSAQAVTTRDLQAARTAATQQQEQLSALQAEVTTLRQRLAASEDAQSARSKQLAGLDEELAATKGALARARNLTESQAAELRAAQSELAAGTDELATLRVHVAKLQSTQKIQGTKEVAALETELKTAHEKIAANQLQTSQQKLLVEQQQALISNLRDELLERDNQIQSDESQIDALRSELASVQATASQPDPDTAVISRLRAEAVELNSKLTGLQAGRTELTAQVDALSSDLGTARAQLASLKNDKESLTRQLANATQPVVGNPADAAKIKTLESDLAGVRQQLADARTAGTAAESQTATLSSLRNDIASLQTDLKQATSARDAADARTQVLSAELADTQVKLAESRTLLASTATTTAPEDDDTELGAVQSKLNTALTSYTLLQDENDNLKTTTEQLTARISNLETQLAMANNATEDLSTQLDTTSATATRANALQEQLRQTADQLSTSRREAADLRTRIAIITPSPSSNYAAPTRPGSAAAATVIAEATTPAPSAEPIPRTHTVVAGDTLSGIALRYYGTPIRWAEIYEANRAKLPNERALRVGMELAIP